MKIKLICFFAVFLHLQIARAQNAVTLTGKLINFGNQVTVTDLSDFQYLKMPAGERVIAPDVSGNFKISFDLAAPNYFRVGRNVLYLSPGDKLNVFIDNNDNTRAIFKGSGQEANRYLATAPAPKSGSFLNAGLLIQYDIRETLEAILLAAQQRSKQLAALKSITPEFRRLEEARIKADIINSFKYVSSYARVKQDLRYTPVLYGMLFNSIAKETKRKYQQNFVDASLMKLPVYRDIAEELVRVEPENPDAGKIKEWYKVSALIDKMKRENDKSRLSAYAAQAEDFYDADYRAAARTYAQNLIKFGAGDAAVDFAAVDADGKKVYLSDLKGKIIYVNLWATWCIPCLLEMPSLEQAKKKYADNPNVAFVTLSIDDNADLLKWKKNLISRKAGGYQWQINRGKLNSYNVAEIPRSFLIDKDFKMVNMNAPMPSSKDLPLAINNLLTIQSAPVFVKTK